SASWTGRMAGMAPLRFSSLSVEPTGDLPVQVRMKGIPNATAKAGVLSSRLPRPDHEGAALAPAPRGFQHGLVVDDEKDAAAVDHGLGEVDREDGSQTWEQVGVLHHHRSH